MKKIKILYFSTFPPQKCGIAQFCWHLAEALEKVNPTLYWRVIVPLSKNQRFKFPRQVLFAFEKENFKKYKEIAHFFNISPFQLLLLQHEFGLFGGEGGEYLFSFLENVKKPVISIMHSIPSPFSKKERRHISILKRLSPFFRKIITLCEKGRERLQRVYNIPSSKILVIPHGTISFPEISSEEAKRKLGLDKNILILVFGFITPKKGYEETVCAFSKILPYFPKAKLVFLGGPHPLHPEKNYLQRFKLFVKKMKLEKSVIIFNKFIPLDLFKTYYKAADIFVSPHLKRDQISSGPLTFALGAGKAIVSTNYDYAKDLLKGKRGILVPIGNVKAMATAFLKILRKPKLKRELEKRALAKGKALLWEKIALKYLKLFEKIL